MNNRIYWNNDWQFIFDFEQTQDWEKAEVVELPHTVCETPLHYFDESVYQTVCAYRREFSALPDWKGKHIFLTVEAAGHSAWVFLNGKHIVAHRCGYTAFSVDLAQHILYNGINELIIKVDSRESQNIPPFGNVIDYMTFGGLYREVYIEVKNSSYISDVFVKTKRLSSSSYELSTEVSAVKGDCRLVQTLSDADGNVLKTFSDTESTHTVTDISEWSIDSPNLYFLYTDLVKDGELVDRKVVRFGFRKAIFRADGFYLNGKKTKIRGLNRHQSYPYVGYAMPKTMQCYDAELLKNELGCNAVRTSHYPQSQHFVDRCDELGLLVFTEIPGWQFIGDEAWKAQAVKNTGEMVLQYRNHPSIILWGVRINESPDDDSFYKQTNKTAHRLDSTRQTSGVRCIKNSQLLEDVYAYNDFSHDGSNSGCETKSAVSSNTEKGYFISEYNGHMFPTKNYDAEEHRVEHMLRHARVMDSYYGENDIAGGFGWCMFDYNTHKDFGSGDRVCYHGVTDMFRNKKLAAYLYSSQQNKNDVLEISSNMDIGEHPACLIKDVYALTNAESVRLYKNDVFIREFTRAESEFKSIPNAPICIDDFIGDRLIEEKGFSRAKSDAIKRVLMDSSRYGIGNLPMRTRLLALKCMAVWHMKMQDAVDLYNEYIGNWGGSATEYRFEAVKDGKTVKTITKKPFSKGRLEINCSHTELSVGTSYDVAAVRIRAVSEEGNTLPFDFSLISLEAEGSIEIIGPKIITTEGGMSGTYIKTTAKTGDGVLKIHSSDFGDYQIKFNIR